VFSNGVPKNNFTVWLSSVALSVKALVLFFVKFPPDIMLSAENIALALLTKSPFKYVEP
jgi:hypothetical protein